MLNWIKLLNLFDNIKLEEPEIKQNIIIKEEAEIESENSQQDEVELDEEESSEGQILGDKFHKEKSVNDLLIESGKLEHKLSMRPLTNLKSSIGINDKFLYISENCLKGVQISTTIVFRNLIIWNRFNRRFYI